MVILGNLTWFAVGLFLIYKGVSSFFSSSGPTEHRIVGGALGITMLLYQLIALAYD